MSRFKRYTSSKDVHKKKMRKKIRRSTIMEDIFRSVLISAFISLTLFFTFLGIYSYQRNINYSTSLLEAETKSITTEIDHYFKDIITIVDILSSSPSILEGDESDKNSIKLEKMLKSIEKKNPNIKEILVGYKNHNRLINSANFKGNYKDLAWYQNALEFPDDEHNVGYFTSKLRGDTTEFIISKTFFKDEEKHGVIAMNCDLSFVYNQIYSKSMFTTNDIFLVNNNFHVVLTRNPQQKHLDIIQRNSQLFNQKESAFNINHNNKKYMIISQKLSTDGWFLISNTNYSEITGPVLPRLFIFFTILIMLTLIVSKIYAKILGRMIAKPVIEVSSALQNLAKGNLNIEKIKDYPKNEVGIMAKSFNKFLDTTESLKADINELTETKADLSYSLSLLNASLESTDDGILIINNKGIMTKWNQRFLEIWGISDDEIESDDDNLVIPKIMKKIVNSDEFYKTIMQVKEDPDMISFDIIELKKGTIIERYSFPQVVDNEIVGRVWRFRDITSIRKSEELLKDSEEKHRVLFTKTVDAYCIMDNGVFVDVNQSAQDMLESPPGWLQGKTPLDISPQYQPDGKLSSEGVKKHIDIAMEKGKHSFKWNHLRYDGSEFPAEITLIKIRLKAKDLLLAIWRDITQEKAMAEKLKVSELNYRILFETMEDMIFIADYKGHIQYTNKSAQEKLGYQISDLMALNLVDLHPDDFSKKAKQIMEDVLAGKRATHQMQLLTQQGFLIPVETKTWLGKWNGKDCIFGLSKDVSKEQEALFMFNKIFESNPNLIALTSYPERRYIDVNDNFCKTLGFSKEEVIGKTTRELNLTMEIEKIDKASAKLFREGNFTNVHLTVNTKSGKQIDGLFSGEVIKSMGQTFFLTVMTDITDIKKLDKKLRESERKYRLLFENMTTGFALHEMIYDQNGKAVDYRFLDVNPAFEHFTGLQASKIIGKTVKEVLPNTEDYWINTYGQVAKTKQSLNYEDYSQVFDKYFEVKAFSPEKDKFATIFSDSTARFKALKSLEKEKELAQAATKAKSEFLANMSHEIRTPLNGVIGFTDLLLSTQLSENQKQFAVNANSSGKALLGIISDILDFSKIEAGKMELDIINSSLTEIMEQAIDIVKFSACKKDLDLILNIPVNFPEKAMVDPLRLKQIFLNLLNNAVKFTNEGEIELSAKFTALDENRGKFIFSVKDTGIGISEQASQRLFKAFSQADGSITRKYGGTGLGLVISNYLASQMGSHIDFISEENAGSEFYFAVETDYSNDSAKRKNQLKGNNILIADINSNSLNVLKDRLEYWGLEVVTTTSVQKISIGKSIKHFDIIMLDEKLLKIEEIDQMDDLIKQHLNNKDCSSIICYCPNDNIDIVKISQKIKADHIKSKPLLVNDLFETLQTICNHVKTSNDYPVSENKIFNQISGDKHFKVLVAEDVDMNMALITTLIKKIIPNVEISQAKNGMEAVYLYKQEGPDLILMDIQMPELDGLEATKTIKRIERNKECNTPIVALTAGAFSDDREKCLAAGMVDFLTKPINVKELTKVLKNNLSLE